MSGRGKGQGVRHRHILRDNIQGLTRPVMHRMAKASGIPRVSAIVYEEVRGVIKAHLEELIRHAVTFTEHRRGKTVTAEDFDQAMKTTGGKVFPRGPQSVYFPALSFERFVREVAQDYKTDLRFTVEALIAFQLASEYYLLEVYNKSKLVMEYAGRNTLYPKDIQIARAIMRPNIA